MKTSHPRLVLSLVSATLLSLYGCGGGGGTGTSEATPVTITGVAATGAAFTDAVITVFDATGAAVGTSNPTVAADGSYRVTLSAAAKAPFVVVATRTSADGIVDSLVSVLKTAVSGVVNITPITNLIASRLSQSGDPLKLAGELATDNSLLSEDRINLRAAEVQIILKPLFDAIGGNAGSTDPLSGSFSANGSGYDRALDSLSIRIVPDVGMANIEIGLKQQQADEAQPVKIQFASNTASAITPIAAPTALLPDGTSPLISDLLSRLNACYALPLTTRVSNGGSTAADISASTCKEVFVGNDPAGFKHNGGVVGKGKAFNGIFVNDGTAVVFSQGSYEFSRNNGDLVIGYKSRSAAGTETFDSFVVRKEDGKLRLIGNQYAYPGGVAAYHQLRKFITLNQSGFDYYSTGYDIKISDVTSGGNSIFNRVVVTSPRGNVLVLKPKTGSSNLNLVGSDGKTKGTSFVRLNSEYAQTTVSGNPADKDTNLVFAEPRFDNTEIAAIPAQSNWKFDYYLAGNTGNTPNTTQYYKTRARALTIPELKTRGLATVTTDSIANILVNKKNDGTINVGNSANVTISYAVAAGMLPPTSLKVFGAYNAGSFDDAITVASTARSGSVGCSSTGGSDTHCSAATFVPSAFATGLHLWAKDSAGREFASFYAAYQLN